MSLWFWIFVALAAAGIIAAIVGLTVAMIGIVRLQRRIAALRDSSFVNRLESFQLQFARLSRLGGDAESLRARAETAVESLRQTPELAGVAKLRTAWLECAAQVRAVVQELS